MRYDYQLIILESKGINYHRKFADYILSKIKKDSQHSFLVNGDMNLLISYLLSKELSKIHVQNYGFEEPYLPCFIDENDNNFELNEYDLIISIFPRPSELQQFLSINTNVIIFLRWEETFADIEKYLKEHPGFRFSDNLDGYYILSNF